MSLGGEGEAKVVVSPVSCREIFSLDEEYNGCYHCETHVMKMKYLFEPL